MAPTLQISSQYCLNGRIYCVGHIMLVVAQQLCLIHASVQSKGISLWFTHGQCSRQDFRLLECIGYLGDRGQATRVTIDWLLKFYSTGCKQPKMFMQKYGAKITPINYQILAEVYSIQR
jgi:hypothetical protein